MRPVDQSKFGYPEGNCLMACVASILEVELCDLPDLFLRCCRTTDEGLTWSDRGEHWLDVLQEGVKVHGWEASWRDAKPEETPPAGYAIAGGPTGRTFDEDGRDVGHCVVCLDGVMVHDPHPERTGLRGKTEDWILLERVGTSEGARDPIG